MNDESNQYISIALPKGRLGEKAYRLLKEIGLECAELESESRKLIFTDDTHKVKYFWVKPSDVPVYVERGAADIGIAGKDILLEASSDVYELLDLNIGKCKMAVAAPYDFVDDNSRTLRVATKFPSIASYYYSKTGRDIDIVKLHGSIELAPLLKISDVIVDIVETGTTLRENGLKVFEYITDISARLIANKSLYKFKQELIDGLCKQLK